MYFLQAFVLTGAWIWNLHLRSLYIWFLMSWIKFQLLLAIYKPKISAKSTMVQTTLRAESPRQNGNGDVPSLKVPFWNKIQLRAVKVTKSNHSVLQSPFPHYFPSPFIFPYPGSKRFPSPPPSDKIPGKNFLLTKNWLKTIQMGSECLQS